MKLLPALAAAATAFGLLATSAAAAAKVGDAAATDAAAAPTNHHLPRAVPGAPGGAQARNPYEGNPGGKPSAAEHRAQKSQRMAERRARVKAALANLPHDPESKLQRMTPDELEKAANAAEEGARKLAEEKGVKVETGFIRKAQKDLSGRKLWGNGNNYDPYEAAGGLVGETEYYGALRWWLCWRDAVFD